jgi:hypothetical protein
MAVPPLIERVTFDAVQARLKSRNPMVTPARVSSDPTADRHLLLREMRGCDDAPHRPRQRGRDLPLRPKRLETVLASVIDPGRSAPRAAASILPSLTGESRKPTSGSAVSLTPLKPAWWIGTMRWRKSAW